jgi:dynactin complex subunit|tara:strand:- start:6207 stop:6401 length:195 start_codon:yes stop_codon:yes gene_type:complete
MSNGFDIKFEGLDMDSDQVQALLKQYKKIKKYQKSNLFAVKTIDGTEDYVSELIKEGEEYGALD